MLFTPNLSNDYKKVLKYLKSIITIIINDFTITGHVYRVDFESFYRSPDNLPSCRLYGSSGNTVS